MAKIPPKRVPSDDCIVTADGVEYRPHEGEWVEVLRPIPIDLLNSVQSVMALGSRLAAIEGDPHEEAQRVGIILDATRDLNQFLAQAVIAWTWTDNDGMALPQPKEDPEVFRRLSQAEGLYLFQIAMGSNPSAEKNDGKPSPITSSATPPPRILIPTAMDRNLMPVS